MPDLSNNFWDTTDAKKSALCISYFLAAFAAASGAFGSAHGLPPHSAPVIPLPSVDGVDAIRRGNLDRLLRARGPVNLCRPRICRIAQPEVQPPVVRTRCSCRSTAHPAAAACRSPADTPSRRSHRAGFFGAAHQPHLHPVMMIRIHIAQQHRRPIYRIDDHIDLAVVEQIAKRRAASRNHNRQPRCPSPAGTYSNFRPLPVPSERCETAAAARQTSCPSRADPPAGYTWPFDFEQVEPSVIVDSRETRRPSPQTESWSAQRPPCSSHR